LLNKKLHHIILTATTSIIGVFVVFFSTNLFAQRDSLTNKTQQLSDLIVTGQYGENSLSKSVYKVRVIDAKKFQAQGSFNLRDVLTNELNIRVTQDPVLGSSMNIQGVGGQNIKILIDGVPVVGRENGSVDLSQINLNNIERIEMVEGPMSVSFGTDALGGVINLISKQPKSQQVKAGINTFAESNGQYNIDGFASISGKKWNSSLSGGRNYFEGFSTDPNSRYKLWKPREQYFADITIGRIIKNGTIRWSNKWFNEKVTNRDSGTITPYFAYGLDQYYYTQRLTSAFFYNQKFNGGNQLNIIASYSGYRRINNAVRKDLVTLQENLVPDASQQDTTFYSEVMSRGTFSKNDKSKKYNYQLGYETNFENIQGNQIRDNSQSISDYSVFASSEIRYSKLLIRPGLRYTYNTLFKAPLIPSLNLKYDISEKLTARASYGRGFRAPSLKELYLNFVDPSHNVQGNPNLNAETGDNFQLSLQYEYKFSERVFRLEPSFFYNHVSNMIDLALLSTSTLEARYFNIDEFKSEGMNLTMEYRAPHYSLVTGYSYTGKSNSLLALTSADQFFFSNEWRANFTYKFLTPDISVSIFYKYNGRLQNYQFDYVANKVNLGYMDPFSLLDVSAGKNFYKKSLNITLGIKNILNVTNIAASISSGVHSSGTNTAQAAMGRTVFISLRYTFQKN